MTIEEATKKYGQEGVQKGNKMLYLTSDGISETVHGYTISEYDRSYAPSRLYADTHKSTPITKDIDSWDKAHDALYGAPTRPDFRATIERR